MTVQQTLPTDQAHMAKEKDAKTETQKLSQQVMLPATGQLAPSRGAATLLSFFSSLLYLTLTLEHLNFKPPNIFVNEPLRQVENLNGEQKPQASSVLLPLRPQKLRLQNMLKAIAGQ